MRNELRSVFVCIFVSFLWNPFFLFSEPTKISGNPILRFSVCSGCQKEVFLFTYSDDHPDPGQVEAIFLSDDPFFQNNIAPQHVHNWGISAISFSPQQASFLASFSKEIVLFRPFSEEEWLSEFLAQISARIAQKAGDSPKSEYFSCIKISRGKEKYVLQGEILKKLIELNKVSSTSTAEDILSSINSEKKYRALFSGNLVVNYCRLEPFCGVVFPNFFEKAKGLVRANDFNQKNVLEKIPELQIESLDFQEFPVSEGLRAVMSFIGKSLFVDPKIKGDFSYVFSKISIRQALEYFIKKYGIAIVEINGVYYYIKFRN